MKGDLLVQAPTGGGCCFVATLPLSPRPDEQVLEALEADLATSGSHLVSRAPAAAGAVVSGAGCRDDNHH